MPNVNISQFELRKKIQEAMLSGKYFITITIFDKSKKKLNHYYNWQHFPEDDVIPSLSHIAIQVEKEFKDEKDKKDKKDAEDYS